MTPGMTMSVIICAFSDDRWETLRGAVESVHRQSLPPYEIVVVIDNNLPLLEQARSRIRDVVVIENKNNQGLSGARNSGVAAARGALIVFLDDDAVAEPDWLEKLAHCYASDRVIGVGGTIEPVWVGKQPTWFPREFYWVLGCTYTGMPETIAPVQRLIGCNMSFRREVFETIGDFRHEIGRIGSRPFSGEETEFSIRARQHYPDHHILFVPEARVHHYVPASRACWRYFRSRCYFEGLSKALLVRFVGPRDGLAAERAYVWRTLPRAVWRGLADVLLRHDLSGVGRTWAVVVGLAATTMGYLHGLGAQWLQSSWLNRIFDTSSVRLSTPEDSG